MFKNLDEWGTSVQLLEDMLTILLEEMTNEQLARASELFSSELRDRKGEHS